MKKYIVLGCLSVAMVAAMSSCKRCTKCKVDYFTKDKDGNKSYTHPQVCGDKNALNFEEDCMHNAYDVTGSVTCERAKKEK
jgi:hypothetical protein